MTEDQLENIVPKNDLSNLPEFNLPLIKIQLPLNLSWLSFWYTLLHTLSIKRTFRGEGGKATQKSATTSSSASYNSSSESNVRTQFISRAQKESWPGDGISVITLLSVRWWCRLETVFESRSVRRFNRLTCPWVLHEWKVLNPRRADATGSTVIRFPTNWLTTKRINFETVAQRKNQP